MKKPRTEGDVSAESLPAPNRKVTRKDSGDRHGEVRRPISCVEKAVEQVAKLQEPDLVLHLTLSDTARLCQLADRLNDAARAVNKALTDALVQTRQRRGLPAESVNEVAAVSSSSLL